ncbi:16S rRNA (uracil1498-N3)-methyltransferase [Acetitomaculum ruminis DSM 5522]|uniref:Ribosomal RNA small subunit methyltransferase E n=1 Tax=Acetitomaculum ruminis DSM 5522 TaxID=1120918 RepID=A0A1I0ZHT0_9FIRM|nr:16S rRNA (uracil(1498)-N(3))-methyltransferase [Acetitomaculum ruminis]SFB24686.1 16S rRNA (uracil1498-N3)-methyltransferase [Acetitomaculum ruminis DSM 5522]
MFQFFVDKENILDDSIIITGDDVNHIKNVLRMKPGTKIRISNKEDIDYICKISDISDEKIMVDIIEKDEKGTELPARVHLFQGLPKGDKMETVIQKCIELGVYEIIPVSMNRSIVKLDEKKKANKVKRYNAISQAAAKQSKRRIIPEVKNVMNFKEALEYSKNYSHHILPYENEEGMTRTKEIFSSIKEDEDIAVFIGPEGGFDESEVELAKEYGCICVTLGKRILRTETAGMAVMAMLMYEMETD